MLTLFGFFSLVLVFIYWIRAAVELFDELISDGQTAKVVLELTMLTLPGVVQTIVLSRAGGRTGVPEREQLDRLAALRASLCIYLSARHVEEVQTTLLEHYPADTPVAIGHRVSWPDQMLTVVPLREMAAVSRERNLIRTTLYVVSPALAGGPQRSRLYSPDHDHLFRPKAQ